MITENKENKINIIHKDFESSHKIKINYFLVILIFLFISIISFDYVAKEKIYHNDNLSDVYLLYSKFRNFPAFKYNIHSVSFYDFYKNFNNLKHFYKTENAINSKFEIPNNEYIKSEVRTKLIEDLVIKNLADKYNVYVSDRELYDKVKDLYAKLGGIDIASKSLERLYNFDTKDLEDNFIKISLLKEKLSSKIINDKSINKESISKINKILNELLESNDKSSDKYFFDLVKRNTEDQNMIESNGQAIWATINDFDKDLYDLLYSMDKNQISDIIKTQKGMYIIKLFDKAIENDTLTKVKVSYVFINNINLDEYLSKYINSLKIKDYIRY